jgi:alpha-ketoglutarate-dependent taurine dioxygenase
MNRRDFLLMKLAALQMKHYGVVDPAFVKEAASELEQLTAGQGSVDPTGTAAGADYATQAGAYAPNYPLGLPHDYYYGYQPQTYYVTQPAAVPPAALAGMGAAGGATSAALIAALLAKKKKGKGNK